MVQRFRFLALLRWTDIVLICIIIVNHSLCIAIFLPRFDDLYLVFLFPGNFFNLGPASRRFWFIWNSISRWWRQAYTKIYNYKFYNSWRPYTSLVTFKFFLIEFLIIIFRIIDSFPWILKWKIIRLKPVLLAKIVSILWSLV